MKKIICLAILIAGLGGSSAIAQSVGAKASTSKLTTAARTTKAPGRAASKATASTKATVKSVPSVAGKATTKATTGTAKDVPPSKNSVAPPRDGISDAVKQAYLDDQKEKHKK